MKKIIKILIIFLLILPLSSCWDSKNLEDLLIVYALGIDIDQDDPHNYLFTIAFPTIIENAPEDRAVFSAEGSSIGRGKTNLQHKVYRQLSYDNIKVITFSKDVAEDGILFHIDSMMRIPLFRGTTRFAVVDGKSKELLDLQPPVSLLISEFLFDSITQNHAATTVPLTTLRNFSNQYYTSGIEPSMPFIEFNKESNQLNIKSTALFRGDKMIHTLDGSNSKGFMVLKGEINRGEHTFEYNFEDSEMTDSKDFISVQFISGKNKIKTDLIDSTLHIYQDISITAHLGEYTPREYIFDESKIQDIESHINSEIKKVLEDTLEILQKELKNDNIGYGKYVKANHPDYFDSEDWNSQFADAIIDVNPRVRIRTLGVTP